MISVVAFSLLSNIQWIVPNTRFVVSIVTMVMCSVPVIVILLLNGALYRVLHRLRKSPEFASASTDIKKALFRASLTNLIAIIFISSQVALVVNTGLKLVSWYS